MECGQSPSSDRRRFLTIAKGSVLGEGINQIIQQRVKEAEGEDGTATGKTDEDEGPNPPSQASPFRPLNLLEDGLEAFEERAAQKERENLHNALDRPYEVTEEECDALKKEMDAWSILKGNWAHSPSWSERSSLHALQWQLFCRGAQRRVIWKNNVIKAIKCNNPGCTKHMDQLIIERKEAKVMKGGALNRQEMDLIRLAHLVRNKYAEASSVGSLPMEQMFELMAMGLALKKSYRWHQCCSVSCYQTLKWRNEQAQGRNRVSDGRLFCL